MKAVFLDIETNGLCPDYNQALEIGVSIYDLHNMTCLSSYSSFMRCSDIQWYFGSDVYSLSINGITFEDVKDAKEINQVGFELSELFLKHDINKINSIFICQNPSFDRAFFNKIISVKFQRNLELPYYWLDLASMYWSLVLVTNSCHIAETTIPLSKDSIAEYLGLDLEEKPHRAMNGVNHLICCYRKLFNV